MSHEHYWTRSLFLTPNVTIEGGKRAPTGPVPVHIDELVTNSLCKAHNEQLGPLDTALSDLNNALREMRRLGDVRGKVNRPWPMMRFMVDGLRIERCMLKMALNCSRVVKTAAEIVLPTWLPDVVFGTRKLNEGVGFASIVKLGETFSEDERYYVAFARSDATGLPSAITVMLQGGWRFICTWDQPVSSMGVLNFEDGSYETSQHAMFHPRGFTRDHGTRPLGIEVRFNWSGKRLTDGNRNVERLRSVYRSPPRGSKKRR